MRKQLTERLLISQARIGTTPLSQFHSAIKERLQVLQDAGVSAHSIVAIEETPAEDFVTSVLAIWLAEAVPLPYTTRPDTPVIQSAFTWLPSKRVSPPQVRNTVTGLESTAVLHVTSGTTGTPKLAKRGVASVLNEAEGYRRGLALSTEDRVCVPVPIAHSYGWSAAFASLMAGCQLDASPAIHAGRTAQRVQKATIAAITAPLARLLADTPGTALAGGPRTVMVGASQVTKALDDAFVGRFGLRLSRNYGSSETGPTFMGEAGLPADTIGTPMHGVSVLQPEPGQQGELLLGLEAPVEGYVGQITPPMSIWATGDLVHRDEEGVFRFIGRIRPKIKLGDKSVDIHGAEIALRGVPGVEDVFSLILPRPSSGIEDIYVVVAGTHIDPAKVENLRPRLPDGTRSARIVYRDKLPTGPNGKVDRSEVTALVRAEWSPR